MRETFFFLARFKWAAVKNPGQISKWVRKARLLLIARGRGGLVTGQTIKRQRLQSGRVASLSRWMEGRTRIDRCKPEERSERDSQPSDGSEEQRGCSRDYHGGVNERIGKLPRFLRKQYRAFSVAVFLLCVSSCPFPKHLMARFFSIVPRCLAN